MAAPICSAEQSCITYGTAKTISANNSAAPDITFKDTLKAMSLGTDFSLCFKKPSTFEEYKNQEMTKIKREIYTKDFDKMESVDFTEFSKRLKEADEKIESTDFEQGFQDYMSSRGCKNEQELKVLNSGWMPYNTMDDLINSVSTQMRVTALSLESNGLVSGNFSALDFNSLVRNADISAIQNYTMGLQFSASFEDRVEALQGFIKSAVDSGNIDISFLHFANAVESAKDNIQIFSDKIKEENLLFGEREDNFTSSEYNEKLIAKYQS